MNFIKTEFDSLYIIEPKVFNDSRGYFFESYSAKAFDQNIYPVHFVQDNESFSSYGTVRGLHFQKPPHAQSKLIRVLQGEILDVVVDLRRDSKTFGKQISVILSESNRRQFFIPRGFAHGFSVLSETAKIQYKCDNLYAPGFEAGVLYNDPELAIDWKIPADKIHLSDKDTKWPGLKEVQNDPTYRF